MALNLFSHILAYQAHKFFGEALLCYRIWLIFGALQSILQLLDTQMLLDGNGGDIFFPKQMKNQGKRHCIAILNYQMGDSFP